MWIGFAATVVLVDAACAHRATGPRVTPLHTRALPGFERAFRKARGGG